MDRNKKLLKQLTEKVRLEYGVVQALNFHIEFVQPLKEKTPSEFSKLDILEELKRFAEKQNNNKINYNELIKHIKE